MIGRRACVIGWPVAQSRSPLIHNYWIEQYRIADARYERLEVAPERLGETLADLPALGFIGGNVTVPHKEAAFAALARCDATARRLKAVNTLVTLADGTLEGRNTDGAGFMAHLKAAAPAWRAARPVVMVGAGGAARAIAGALADAGMRELRLVNRTRARAEALVRDLDLAAARTISIHDWDARGAMLTGAGLLVNTTSLGMAGQAPLDLDPGALPMDAVVADIVYAPLETALLAAARARGLRAVDGLGMLLHQAVPGFEAWFGVRPEVTPALRALVAADLEKGV